MIGHLREFTTRVVAIEICDDQTNLIANAEGELGELNESAPGEWSFSLGGTEPPEVEDVRFIVASWLVIHLDRERVLEAHNIATGVGVTAVVRVQLAGGTSITVWPAMPLREQWTDRHTENR